MVIEDEAQRSVYKIMKGSKTPLTSHEIFEIAKKQGLDFQDERPVIKVLNALCNTGWLEIITSPLTLEVTDSSRYVVSSKRLDE